MNQNAETWSNLGVLYLEQDNIKVPFSPISPFETADSNCMLILIFPLQLAHNAFKNAQSSEPTYPLSWVGQAFIADKVKHSETLDLYRHAASLGSHVSK